MTEVPPPRPKGTTDRVLAKSIRRMEAGAVGKVRKRRTMFLPLSREKDE